METLPAAGAAVPTGTASLEASRRNEAVSAVISRRENHSLFRKEMSSGG